MTKTHTLLILFLSIVLVYGQNMYNPGTTPPLAYDATQGAMYRHIYSTLVQYYNPTTPTPSATLDITSTLPTGIFHDDQQITTASGLVAIEGTAGTSTASTPTKQLILRVKSIIVNSARTAFTMSLQFNTTQFPTPSTYRRLGFNVILIGSKFNTDAPQWVGSTTPLAGAMARNSDLVAVTQASTPPTPSFVKVNFTGTANQPSPFAYIPSDASGCGVRRMGAGTYQIETNACEKPIFLTFLTGFSHEIGASSIDIMLQSLLVKDQTSTESKAATVAAVPTVQTTDATKSGYIFNPSAPGLWIRFEQSVNALSVHKIQFGMIAIMIKRYPSAPTPNPTTDYPVQDVYRDSFVTAIGYLGTTYTSSAEITQTATNIKDGFLSTSGAVDLNTLSYLPNSNLGHIFCGLQKIRGTALQLDLSTDTTTTGLLQTSTVRLEIPQFNAASIGAATCVLFATRTPCTSSDNTLTVDYAKYNTSITSPVAGTALPTLTTPRPDNQPSYGTAPADPTDMYKFTITSVSGKATYTIINMTYTNIPAGQTELVYDLTIQTNAATPANQIYYTLYINGTTYPIVNIVPTATASGTVYPISYVIHVPAGTTQMPVSLNITTTAVANGASTITVYQALAAYSKVLTPDLQCLIGCPEKAGFSTGVNITTSPPTCLYCSADLNQVYDDNTCVCRDYFYSTAAVPLDCQPCSKILCTDCNATSCLVCVGNATLIQGGSDVGNCACNDGFFRNGSVCSPCPIGCTKCTSATSCQACVSAAASSNSTGFNTRQAVSLNCVCKAGFYQVPTSPVCQPCAASCPTCSGSATFCTSCPTTANVAYNPSTGACLCAEGYFLLNSECKACSPVCKTCNIGSIYCLTCPANSQLAATGDLNFQTCKCVAPYVQFQGVCVDSTCADIPFCSTCAIMSNNVKFCLTCTGNRYVLQDVCVCKPGFYPSTPSGSTIEQCLACGTGCQVCTNSTVCLTCATDASNNMNGSCSCRDGQFLTDISQGYICMACDRNCLTCQVSSTTCKACKSGFELNALKKCVCSGAAYPSLDGTQCIACSYKCLKCDNATSCTTCQTGYAYDATTFQCSLSCSAGTYNGGTQCLQCSPGCATCMNQFLCYGCLSGYSLYAGSCRSQCPDTTYPDRSNPTLAYSICRLCPVQCKTCTSLTSCSNCNDGYVLQGTSCVASCARGTYLSAGSCRACNASCAACLGTENTCTQCAFPLILYNSACYQSCPVTTINGQCTNICPPGQYSSGTQCLSCDPKCTSCSTVATNCTACVTGYAYSGQCVTTCPPGMYAGTGFCGTCDASCKTCLNTPQNCLVCQDGFLRSGTSGSCVRTCGDGWYVDTVQQVCRACNVGCRTCTATACLTCTDPTQSPIGAVCQFVCPSGTTPINGRCVCNFGVLYNNLCISSCPDGTYPTIDRTCERCASPCLNCQGTATTCLSCVAGYTYDNVNRRCSRVSNCAYGLQEVNGICARICPFNLYYYQTGCIYQCPPNTRPNQNYACIQSVNPSFCQFPQFQQGSTCVNTCPVGFWPNTATRTCDRCAANCAQCLSATYCLGCAGGYFLNYGQTQCVISQGCPTGQYQYNGQCYVACPIGTYQSSYSPICIRACPARTYLDNNWCFSTCRTPLVTPDACVTVCPPNTQCRATSGR